MGIQAALQGFLRAIYPPQCLGCEELVEREFALCPDCWRDTPFVAGLCCDRCGIPLPGQEAPGTIILCDDCLRIARPWARGRAVMMYQGKGRTLVLGLKHGDRTDLAHPAGGWLARAAAPLLLPGMIVAPVPLHWLRLAKRRYNQSALLSAALARETGLAHVPDLLLRRRATPSQDGRSRDGRFANLAQALSVHPRHAARIEGRPVLLVDDVMTSGATLAAGADALLAQGASAVHVVVLARVGHDGGT
jgi:predicted amidophosphoribosyltransferase